MTIRVSEGPRKTQWNNVQLTSVCNDTKWELLRSSIASLGRRPSFRIRDLNETYTDHNHEWDYHFRLGGYATTRYVDIFCSDDEMNEQVLAMLRLNHVSGHAIEGGFRVYGYTEHGDQIAKF